MRAVSLAAIAAVLFGLTCLVSYGDPMDLPEGLYNVPYSSAELNDIQELFPERGGINPSYIESTTDPNIRFTSEGTLSVTYIDEGAGYKNKFGYFTFDENNNILTMETIFENASGLNKGGALVAGDTLDLGTFQAGDNVGFWLQSNGYNDPDAPIFYTLDELNPDGMRHMAIVADEENERLVVGIEDMYNLGDQDYNDIVFTFDANPYSAIDTTNIPSATPTPGVAATALLSLAVMFGGWRRRESSDG